MRKSKYTKEYLTKIVAKSNSYRDVVRNAGIKTDSGGSLEYLKKLITDYKINTSHFYSKEWKSVVFGHKLTLKQFKKTVLCKNGKWQSTKIRKRLIELHLLLNKCRICGLEPIWNEKKLTLQLDHINGNKSDNRLKNLRLLCPNCHSQTKTYSKRKNMVEVD